MGVQARRIATERRSRTTRITPAKAGVHPSTSAFTSMKPGWQADRRLAQPLPIARAAPMKADSPCAISFRLPSAETRRTIRLHLVGMRPQGRVPDPDPPEPAPSRGGFRRCELRRLALGDHHRRVPVEPAHGNVLEDHRDRKQEDHARRLPSRHRVNAPVPVVSPAYSAACGTRPGRPALAPDRPVTPPPMPSATYARSRSAAAAGSGPARRPARRGPRRARPRSRPPIPRYQASARRCPPARHRRS